MTRRRSHRRHNRPRITVLQRGGNNRSLIVSHWATDILDQFVAAGYASRRLVNLFDIRIELRASKLKKRTIGICDMVNHQSGRRRIRIIIARDLSDFHLLLTLAHELAHAVQMAQGRLVWTSGPKGAIYRWRDRVGGESQLVAKSEVKHEDRPWEREANHVEWSLGLQVVYANGMITKEQLATHGVAYQGATR